MHEFVIGDRVQLVELPPAVTVSRRNRVWINKEKARKQKRGFVPEKRGWVVKRAVINNAVKFAVRLDGTTYREWFSPGELLLVNPLERMAEEF
jgi:hypothetical protein